MDVVYSKLVRKNIKFIDLLTTEQYKTFKGLRKEEVENYITVLNQNRATSEIEVKKLKEGLTEKEY